MNNNKEQNMNFNLISPSFSRSEGVFATRDEAIDMAARLNMRTFTIALTDRECWSKF